MKVGTIGYACDSLKTGVYGILNLKSKKWYVGSASKSLVRRKNQHFSGLKKGHHKNRHLQSAWDRYGSSAFVFRILERCLPEQCISKEQFWMDKLKSWDRQYGYNAVPNAGSVLGLVHSDETKKRLSLITTEYFEGLTPEERLKYGRGMRGKTHTPEVIERIRETSSGRIPSEETRKRMSQAQKAIGHKNKSEEYRAKLRAAWVLRKARGPSLKELEGHKRSGEKAKGRVYSKEARSKMSAWQKGKPKSLEHRAKIAASLTGRRLSEEHRQAIKLGRQKSKTGVPS